MHDRHSPSPPPPPARPGIPPPADGRPPDADFPPWSDLPPEMVQAIGASLPFVTRHTVLPLVCKAWRDAAAGPSALWTDVDVSARAEAAGTADGGGGARGRGARLRGPDVRRWLEARGGQLRRLALRLDTDPTPKAAPPATADDLSPVAAAAAVSPRLSDLELDLRGARLTAWPDGEADLGRLTALTALRLDGGAGGARDRVGAPPLPANLTALASLRHLSATRLGFASLPPVIPHLTTLAHLDLSGNAGMDAGGAAGAGLGGLTALTALLLAGAAPGGPPPAALAALPALAVLDLGADPEAAFGPPALGGGGGGGGDEGGGDLAAGALGGGGAAAARAGEFVPPLPPAGLPALTALDLSGRPLGAAGLAALDAGLAASHRLARLSLAGCGPGVGPDLPAGLARHAPRLECLDVSHCGLLALPPWLGAAPRLACLDARANPGLVLRHRGGGGGGGGGGGEGEEGPPPDDVAALAAVAGRGGASAAKAPGSRPALALAKAGDAGWEPASWAALLALAAAVPGLAPSALVATARGRAAVAAARGG